MNAERAGLEYKRRNNKESKSWLNLYFLAAFVRVWLSTSEYQKVIADRIEVSTPINSWKRVSEALFLSKLGVHPYQGDTLHEPPLNLLAYEVLTSLCGEKLHLVFVVCDVATAYFLYLAAKCYLLRLRKVEHEEAKKKSYCEDLKHIRISRRDLSMVPSYVALVYLYNPFTLFNCVGFTTTVFTNLFKSLSLVGLLRSNLFLSSLSLAICASYNFYPISLLAPMLLQFSKQKLATTTLVIFFLTLLMCGSFYVHGNWSFLGQTHGFILTAPDLRPNIGLFWYFFTEMFVHFRTLFIWSFQINVALLYVVPLTICFRKDPMVVAGALLALTAVFKSYPCLGDVGFVMALLPCWKHLFKYMQQGYLVGCSFVATSALAPVIWHLWIYSGSANANFYFGITLAFAATQIFLITDVLFAYLKRQHHLAHGNKWIIDSKPAKLRLE